MRLSEEASSFPGTISFISSRNSQFPSSGKRQSAVGFSSGGSFLLEVSTDIPFWHRFRERKAFSGSRNFFLVQRWKDRSIAKAGKLFAIWHFLSTVFLPWCQLTTCHVGMYGMREWNWNCRCLFRALATRCYYFNERCSSASRCTIERSIPQRDVGWLLLHWTFIHSHFPSLRTILIPSRKLRYIYFN